MRVSTIVLLPLNRNNFVIKRREMYNVETRGGRALQLYLLTFAIVIISWNGM
jgi:hypothetical protein